MCIYIYIYIYIYMCLRELSQPECVLLAAGGSGPGSPSVVGDEVLGVDPLLF